MDLDFYDEDLPGPYLTLAESWSANKGTLTTVGKVIAVPVGAFLITCLFNSYVKKKLETL